VGHNKKKAKNETRKDRRITFHTVTSAPMLLHGSENWFLNGTERMKTETAELRFSRRVSGYTLTDHVRSTTVRNALQIHALEERM
jgi:hypothetical protein